ncbi:MAG: hypothetical protein ABSG64_07725 [Solirubrobacteraceae bacterium]
MPKHCQGFLECLVDLLGVVRRCFGPLSSLSPLVLDASLLGCEHVFVDEPAIVQL